MQNVHAHGLLAGTREAVAEQLRLGQELRRKVDRPDSASEDAALSSEDDDSASDAEAGNAGEGTPAGGRVGRSALAKAKAAAMDIINGAQC